MALVITETLQKAGTSDGYMCFILMFYFINAYLFNKTLSLMTSNINYFTFTPNLYMKVDNSYSCYC